MKVVASINDNMVLCEVSQAEIARLHGVASHYDKDWNRVWLTVGFEHDMVEAFKAVDTLRGFDKAQFHYVQSRMETMMQEFGAVKEAYEKLTLFDTLKEVKTEEEK
jgi:hypothetical protein